MEFDKGKYITRANKRIHTSNNHQVTMNDFHIQLNEP